MFFLTLLFALFVCVCCVGVRVRAWFGSKRVSFPPGPRGLPLLGLLPQFRSAPLASLLSWKQQYGPIVGLQLGEFQAVLISDFAFIKEALSNEAFNGRPALGPFEVFAGGDSHGTLTSAGDSWNTIRRFTVKQLNALGFGRQAHEVQILEAVQGLCERLKPYADSGHPVQLREMLCMPVSANLWTILTGNELNSQNEPAKYEHLQRVLLRVQTSLWLPIGSPVWFLPTLTRLFPGWSGWTELTAAVQELQGVMTTEISNLESDGAEDGPNFISDFLARIRLANADTNSEFHGPRGRAHLLSMIMNLIVTASGTVANTLCWAALYLGLYPAVQGRVYAEIRATIGERVPSFVDLDSMPYTRAFLEELVRIASTSPFANFHATTTTVQDFHGYCIPKGTVIIANLYALHHDPLQWGDPEVFRPERFLDDPDSATATLRPPHPTLPFSIGLRTCIGQTYAKQVIFLFLATMVQRYEFGVVDDGGREWTAGTLTDKSRVSAFRICPDFQTVLKQRSFDTR